MKSVNEDLDQNEKDTYNNHRIYLEHYAYLVYWFLISAEDNTTTTKNTRKTKVIGTDLKSFDWSAHKLKAFDLINWLLALKLSKIWTLTSDRTNFVNLFTKPAYQLLENPVQARSRPIKDRVFRTLSLCIKDYDHLFGKKKKKVYCITIDIDTFFFIISCSNDDYATSSVLGTFS